MNKNKYLIITTINSKTKAILEFEKLLVDWHIVLVGDKKSKPIENSANVTFLSVADQEQLSFGLYHTLPFNHYVRKNLGYLFALKNGAEVIYDTDDDNLPYEDWGFPELNGVDVDTIQNTKYFNVYKAFSDTKVWPRGYPLPYINKADQSSHQKQSTNIGAWQGLADLDPDVDAIHRLLYNEQITFNKREPLALEAGVYCPFNSQNTLWHIDMIPYAYLPATVTFRFTDILRGYIAQRCFWAHEKVLGFTNATVYQERNEHDLMIDFESEIPCYMKIEELVGILDGLELNTDYEHNLRAIYGALATADIVQHTELDILDAWLTDLKTIYHG